MNANHILNLHRQELAEYVGSEQFNSPRPSSFDISPWLAMSLLQKAIRRGEVNLALQAAATLLRDNPDRLWRRLCVTAFEDIGVADFETVSLTMAGLTGKHWRSKNGGGWRIACNLIHRMCSAVKCRSADDLAYVCEQHPKFEQAQLKLTFKPIPELLDVIASKAPLPERALALWYAVGTHRCRSSVLRERKGDPYAILDALCKRGFPDTVVEVCRVGLTKSGEIMAPFTALLWPELQSAPQTVERDEIPQFEMIGDIPGWAYDMHTREGKQAIGRFLKTNNETTRWLADTVRPADRHRLTGNMIFRIEGGCVDQRLRWEVGDRVRQMCDVEIWRLDPKDMTEGLRLLRLDVPLLNEARVAAYEVR